MNWAFHCPVYDCLRYVTTGERVHCKNDREIYSESLEKRRVTCPLHLMMHESRLERSWNGEGLEKVHAVDFIQENRFFCCYSNNHISQQMIGHLN